ncbi:RagB/SusD family nutrient uptake outer membrane protein [Zunongwangia profunda]|uniref:RagB/SusD family nutrient uptake outer membrane protein n=1 Tax=Zunongwangia profunda TaxID=398743 RepID=UPI001D197483|nr:RagB/SusD family nutrient uptake outer membrane protein [Zunongwangia profunda]MCC4227187.1 RagB/SusD family nutrient uptake outer membrane protein [Zunongwangia profunda]|tara:strand:+ start:2811 stop:4220 length:1410 start_codon:yes stop_codon:yes gene_type:complete
MNKRYIYIALIALSFGVLTSCSEDDLEPTLQQSKVIDNAVGTINDLQVILNGAYNRMSLSAYYGRDKIILGEVFADNAYSNANSNRFVAEARMDLLPTSGISESFWSQMYAVIASANIVINATDIEIDPLNAEADQAEIDQIKGEAYAIRALAHFDLLTFYGQQNVNGGGESSLGVPYVTTFRKEEDLFPPRNTVGEVKNMAYDDLEMAQSLMNAGSTNPEFMNLYAAYAIEARIANYFEDWERSLEASQFVIESGNYSIIESQDFVSSYAEKGSDNTIFEIAARENDNEGINGLANIYQATTYGDVVALPNLAAIYESGDVRGVGGIITQYESGTLRNTGKYPSIAPYDDDIPVIRYEEVVLLYAEALLETASGEALVWLNSIPTNRGASTYSVANKENILLERRKELAFEGFRFHDLARTGMDIPVPDGVLQTHGGPEYGSYNFALPIPLAEDSANANLDQNFGYGN